MATAHATSSSVGRILGSLRLPIGIVAFLGLSPSALGIEQIVIAPTLGAIYAHVDLGYTMAYGII